MSTAFEHERSPPMLPMHSSIVQEMPSSQSESEPHARQGDPECTQPVGVHSSSVHASPSLQRSSSWMFAQERSMPMLPWQTSRVQEMPSLHSESELHELHVDPECVQPVEVHVSSVHASPSLQRSSSWMFAQERSMPMLPWQTSRVQEMPSLQSESEPHELHVDPECVQPVEVHVSTVHASPSLQASSSGMFAHERSSPLLPWQTSRVQGMPSMQSPSEPHDCAKTISGLGAR